MVKKFLLFFVFILFIISGCASGTTKEKENSNESGENIANNEMTEEQTESLVPTVLYEYEHDEEEDYDIWQLTSSYDGSTIIFNVEQTIKRESDRFDFILYGDNQVRDLRELSPHKNKEEESCRQEHVSSNGRYIAFNCLKVKDTLFMIYDLEEDKLIHQEPEWEEFYSLDILGITDDLTVFLREDYEDNFIVYNFQTNSRKDYFVSDYTDVWDGNYESAIVSMDGKKVLFLFYDLLLLLDLETDEVKEIANTEKYHEVFNTEDIKIQNVRLSPTGKYVYARISEFGSDPIYESHNFLIQKQGK